MEIKQEPAQWLRATTLLDLLGSQQTGMAETPRDSKRQQSPTSDSPLPLHTDDMMEMEGQRKRRKLCRTNSSQSSKSSQSSSSSQSSQSSQITTDGSSSKEGSSDVKKGIWSEEEDTLLRQLVEEALGRVLGEDEIEFKRSLDQVDAMTDLNWSVISEKIHGRNAKQCRERWCYNLDPRINKGEWTPEEDKTLLSLQKEMGNKWSFIAKALPGRTEHTVKTRFRSICRAARREWKPHEDQLLLMLQKQFGSQWHLIAERFPNRTKNALATRYKQLKALRKTQKALAPPVPSGATSGRFLCRNSMGTSMGLEDPVRQLLLEELLKLQQEKMRREQLERLLSLPSLTTSLLTGFPALR